MYKQTVCAEAGKAVKPNSAQKLLKLRHWLLRVFLEASVVERKRKFFNCFSRFLTREAAKSVHVKWNSWKARKNATEAIHLGGVLSKST